MRRFDFAAATVFGCLGLVVVGCGGGAPESSAPAPAAEAPAAEAAPAPPPAAPAGPSAPTTDEAYDGTMKMVSTRFRDLRDNLKNQSAGNVAKEARMLEQLFTGVETFWTGRQTPEAAGFAKAAMTAAQSIAVAAEANDLAKAEAGVKTLDAQCQSCHKSYRIQDGDYYSIK